MFRLSIGGTVDLVQWGRALLIPRLVFAMIALMSGNTVHQHIVCRTCKPLPKSIVVSEKFP